MPSPFPGMDPYLENPGLWPGVHHRLITVSGDLLTERLRPRYYARIEDRVYISDDRDPGRRVIIPDLRIARHATEERSAGPAFSGSRGIGVVEPLEVTTLVEDEIHEARIEVVDSEDREVVTVIEFLSPTNKVRRSRGRRSYRQKRLEVLNSSSHLIEIDLLRGGQDFIPKGLMPAHDYSVHLSPVDKRPKGKLWPIRLEHRLPVIPIPLKEEDPDSELDLQAVFTSAYDRGAYELQVDYKSEPMPPLRPEQVDWAHRLLCDRGLRKAASR